MTGKDIAINVNRSIELLYEKDAWLFEHDLSEQSISHKLAIFLQELFPDFHVDCEYNGNAMDHNAKKKIYLIKEQLQQIGKLMQHEADDIEKKISDRAVFPDIIIHERGTNAQNKCIIEIKKSTSNIQSDYDIIKVHAYTSDLIGNSLSYQIGVFIKFRMGIGERSHDIHYYKNGIEIEL